MKFIKKITLIMTISFMIMSLSSVSYAKYVFETTLKAAELNIYTT